MQAFVIDNTGEVVGGASAQPCGVTFNGFMFSNSAGAVGSVAFYIPAAVANGRTPAVPSAGGTLLFTIQVLANSSKEFIFPKGVYFKDGLFAKASASTVTGVVLIN